nr:6.5 kda intracrystalline chromoprotein {N-terminal} [Terebratella sanguinea, Leach, red brachiopod shells, Peptide Partial, 20 aa] [Terebratella sanguinea]
GWEYLPYASMISKTSQADNP